MNKWLCQFWPCRPEINLPHERKVARRPCAEPRFRSEWSHVRADETRGGLKNRNRHFTRISPHRENRMMVSLTQNILESYGNGNVIWVWRSMVLECVKNRELVRCVSSDDLPPTDPQLN